VLPVWHAPVLSQQPAQDVPSHAQTPPLQACPVLHAGPEPHWHAPVESQPSLVFVSHAKQEQRPSVHVWPGAQSDEPHVGPGCA
jgi:hypothetical protein